MVESVNLRFESITPASLQYACKLPKGAEITILRPVQYNEENENLLKIVGRINEADKTIVRLHDNKSFSDMNEFALDSMRLWNPKRRCCRALEVCTFNGRKLKIKRPVANVKRKTFSSGRESMGRWTKVKTDPELLQDQNRGTFYLSPREVIELRCTVCKSKYDEANMLLCDNIDADCKNCTHIYCCPEKLSDDYMEKDWFCVVCRKANQPNDSASIIDIRTTSDGKIEYFVLPQRQWQAAVSDELLLQFSKGEHLKNISNMRWRNGIPITFTETDIIGKVNCTRKTYSFARNETKFGIVQWNGAFSKDELEVMKGEILHAIHPSKMKTYKENTIDIEPCKKRIKLFLNYRYSYGHGCKRSELYDDVNKINQVIPLTSALFRSKLQALQAVKDADPFNQAVINIYSEKSSSLGIHQDDLSLFELPIFSLRLFSDSALSFGCKGVGMQETDTTVSIPLPNGVITSMSGIAATNFTHCIRYQDIKQFSVSIIFRRVKLDRLVPTIPKVPANITATSTTQCA